MSCRLDFDNVEFWKKKYDEEANDIYYEKVRESISIYFKMVDHDYIFDKMICNCNNGTENMRLREYENNNYYVIEPSGIKTPKNKLVSITDKNIINNDENGIMEDISVNTFFCNCISDRTRGGRNQILASEVEEYKEDIIKTIYDNYSTKSFNSFDLISMFSIISYEHDIYSFDRDKLLQYIIDNKEESKYSRILSSIEINYGEHYDESKSLDKAIDALKYVGMLHPDYSKEDTYDYNPYINLAIDNNIRYWLEMGMDKKLKELYPEIIEFVDEYNSVSDNITAGIKSSYRRKK